VIVLTLRLSIAYARYMAFRGAVGCVLLGEVAVFLACLTIISLLRHAE
jgi:hypothetical protein